MTVLAGHRKDPHPGYGSFWGWRDHHVFPRILRVEPRIQLFPTAHPGPPLLPTSVQVHRSHHRLRTSGATHLQSSLERRPSWVEGQGPVRPLGENRPIKTEDPIFDKDYEVSFSDTRIVHIHPNYTHWSDDTIWLSSFDRRFCDIFRGSCDRLTLLFFGTVVLDFTCRLFIGRDITYLNVSCCL